MVTVRNADLGEEPRVNNRLERVGRPARGSRGPAPRSQLMLSRRDWWRSQDTALESSVLSFQENKGVSRLQNGMSDQYVL